MSEITLNDLRMPEMIILRTAVTDGVVSVPFYDAQFDEKQKAAANLIKLGLLKLNSDGNVIPTDLGKGLFPQASAEAAETSGGELTLQIGQLVRFTSKRSEIPYGSFGIVKAYDLLLNWYDVQFGDGIGLMSINPFAIEPITAVFINTLETDNEALRRRLEIANAEAKRVREALQPFARTYQTWLERPNTDTTFADWLKGHLTTKKSAFNRHARVWFEQALAAAQADADSGSDGNGGGERWRVFE